MRNQINSKDSWWAGILCVIASLVAIDPFSRIGLLISALIFLIYHISLRKNENKRY